MRARGSAQAESLDALGDGALDAGAVSVAAAPVIGVRLDAGLLEDVVLGSRPQGQVAAGLGLGAGGAQFAGAAAPFREADTGDRGESRFATGCPDGTIIPRRWDSATGPIVMWGSSTGNSVTWRSTTPSRSGPSGSASWISRIRTWQSGWPASNTWEAASTASAAAGGQAPVRQRKRAPAGVSATRRLVRWNSSVPKRRSNRCTVRLTRPGKSPAARRCDRSAIPRQASGTPRSRAAGHSTWLAPGVTGVPDDTSPCQPTRSERRPYGRPARMRHSVSVNACTRDVKPSRRQIRP